MLRLLFFALFLTFPWISALTENNDAELVHQETDILIKSSKLYKTLTYELKIYNRAGEKFTKVSIPYSKLIKISKLEAIVKDYSGTTIKKLQKGDITDRSAFSDNFTDSFSADTTDLLIKYSWGTSYKNIIEPEFFSPPVMIKYDT